MPTRLEIARPRILREFSQYRGKVLTPKVIEAILRDRRDEWRLGKTVTTARFVEFLKDEGELSAVRIALSTKPVTRFTWGDVPTLQIIQSLNTVGYFSHYTAIALHGLTLQAPKTVYFNVEQRASSSGGRLTQHGIDLAFRRRCRVSNNRAVVRDRNLIVLNGQNTHFLGVQDFSSSEGQNLRVTDLERTLIDAAVRPVYSGGVAEVAGAYKEARGRIRIDRLVNYLKILRFTYPFHQAIGYYLDRTGDYTSSDLEPLRLFPIEFDFYLAYEMKDPSYNARWRIYVPQGM